MKEKQSALHNRTPQLVLKPFFPPYLMVTIMAGSLVAFFVVVITKGTLHSLFDGVVQTCVILVLIAGWIFVIVSKIFSILYDRIYFYEDSFVYLTRKQSDMVEMRYDEVEKISYDSGWNHGAHITVLRADGRTVKVSGNTFNHHRFGREIKNRVTNAGLRKVRNTQ